MFRHLLQRMRAFLSRYTVSPYGKEKIKCILNIGGVLTGEVFIPTEKLWDEYTLVTYRKVQVLQSSYTMNAPRDKYLTFKHEGAKDKNGMPILDLVV